MLYSGGYGSEPVLFFKWGPSIGSVFSNETVAQKLKKQCIRYNGNLTNDMIITSKQNEKIGYIGPVAICAKKFFFESQEQ